MVIHKMFKHIINGCRRCCFRPSVRLFLGDDCIIVVEDFVFLNNDGNLFDVNIDAPKITPKKAGWTTSSKMHNAHSKARYHTMNNEALSISTSHDMGAASSMDNANSKRQIRRQAWKILCAT